ncbi:MAG: hypothetical protein ACK4YV_07020 [Emticicia sp.]
MKTEEFYGKIQEKIDQTNFEPDWNKSEIWQRIEQKQTKRKTPFVWWQAVAASIVLLGGVGMYFYNQKTDITTNNQVVNKQNSDISTKSSLNPTTESTQLLADNDNRKNNVAKEMAMTNKPIAKQLTSSMSSMSNEENLVAEEPAVAVNEAQNSVSANENEVKTNQQTPANDNYRFVPYQGFVEKRVAPQRRERVAILEIPDDEENYNQSPQKEKKNGLVARLSRKIGKKGVEPAEELPAINSKPNKVWAFVKESFKNETLTADSTNR